VILSFTRGLSCLTAASITDECVVFDTGEKDLPVVGSVMR